MRAILFIHGLSAKEEDNKYFIDRMRQFRNIDIYSFTLPGHSNDKVSRVKYSSWIEKSEEELNNILKKYKSVTIVAHSMGCIIATNLAARYKQVNKLVLISPAFIAGNIKQNKIDFKNIIFKKVDEELGTGFEGFLTKFITIPKSVWFEYRKMARINMSNISRITCPTLIMYGDADNLVSKKSVDFVYDNLTCKKDLVIIKRVRHQVFKSSKKERITKYIYKFITFNLLYKLGKSKTI